MNQRSIFLKHLAQTSDSPQILEISHGNGIYLYDINNKKYIDLISGISVSNLGHNHQEIIQSIHNQVDKHLHTLVYGEFVLNPQVELVSQLLKVLPEKLNNIYLVNSGTEATEAAMKLAKRYTGRKKIIATTKSYHGSTQGALSLMSDTYFTEAFQPLLPHIEFINFNNVEDLNKIDKDTAAVITETVKAEVGVEKPKNNYLKKLKEKCVQENVLLILDEIQVGCGRTGTFFAFEQYDIEPDILLLAKGLGAGMPIGAFISNIEIMKTLSYNPVLGHITTFGGHPVSAAAAAENIKILQRDYAQLIKSVKEKENRFLSKLKHPKIKEIRSAGLLIAVELDSFETVKKTMNQCLENGLITDWFLFNDSALRIAPPLIISMEEIDQAINILLKSLDHV